MIRPRFLAAAFSFLMLTACGSSSGDSSAAKVQSGIPSVTAQSENSSVIAQSESTFDNIQSGSSVSAVTSDRQEFTTDAQQEERESDGMQIVIGDERFTVTLESSDTVTALTQLLPLNLDMSELNGNEKYYYLDTALPSAPENVGYIDEGDIMLYGDNCLVVFYESFDTSYSYTKIGHIDDTSGLADALGTGDVTVEFI